MAVAVFAADIVGETALGAVVVVVFNEAAVVIACDNAAIWQFRYCNAPCDAVAYGAVVLTRDAACIFLAADTGVGKGQVFYGAAISQTTEKASVSMVKGFSITDAADGIVVAVVGATEGSVVLIIIGKADGRIAVVTGNVFCLEEGEVFASRSCRCSRSWQGVAIRLYP